MQRTSDIFNAANLFKNPTNKVALPNPHITMRKKNTIVGDDQHKTGGSVLRRSGTGSSILASSSEDPMASTLQKWREQVKDSESIIEEDDY